MRLDWALDVEFAGAPYRFATRRLEVDGEVYLGGLGPLSLSKLADLDASVQLQIRTRDDWPARFAAVGWLVDGGKATLYLVITEDDGTVRREIWRKGRIDGARWDRAGRPLSCKLRTTTKRLELPNPRERIDPFTSPSSDSALPSHTGSWNIYTDNQGEYYPIPIGYPGYDDVTGSVWPVVPVPTMQFSRQTYASFDDGPQQLPEVYVHVVGIGAIEASLIWLTDAGLTRSEESGTGNKQHPLSVDVATGGVGVTLAQDKLGQRFSFTYRDLSGSPAYPIELWGGTPKPYVGFSPASGYGGGLIFQGKLLRGAADLFEWAIGQYTDAPIDIGRHRANAEPLNRYHFDTFINQKQDAVDWLREILEDVPSAFVWGSEGVYLAHIPIRADRSDAVAHLDADETGVEWLSMTEGTLDAVANEITFRWGPQRDGNAYVNSRTLTAAYKQVIAVPGGGVYRDDRAVAHALCLASQRSIGEVRPMTLDLPTVWEQATAFQMAADAALQLAFPSRTFTYSLPVEQHERVPGDVVTLSDADRSLSDVLFVVVDVVVSVTHVEVVLRPVRGLDLYL